MKTIDVFGINTEVRNESYVDRGELDSRILRLLERNTHLALRGESKCGKSWLRKKLIKNGIVVQCRLDKKVVDIYTDALSQIGIELVLNDTKSGKLEGQVRAKAGTEGGGILATIFGFSAEVEAKGAASHTEDQVRQPIGKDVNDLRYIADILKESGKKLIIEDFHYLSSQERKLFSHDLKALWDYGVFVVIVGVWSQSNLLIYLNSDLSGRVEEIAIHWSESDLKQVLEKGSEVLNIQFNKEFVDACVKDSYGNVGILQAITLRSLDIAGIYHAPGTITQAGSQSIEQSAALEYAEQLDPLYQQFGNRLSNGVRLRRSERNNSPTRIYAHTLAVILEAPDDAALRGLSVDYIYEKAHARQPRIQKGNLKAILEKFEELQVDEDGRGLVLSYNPATSELHFVDRQILLYRKYCTVKWAWEDMDE